MQVSISKEISQLCPHLVVAVIQAKVLNSPSSEGLSSELTMLEDSLRSQYSLSDINRQPAIEATRKAYKTLGKEPSRYRPSAEALCRRILRDMPLYRINTLVDIINIISIQSGYSIGAFDADQIQGESLELGVGRRNEAFEAIGRGNLNVEGLPLYRDAAGGIGTPTSDHERTKITESTTNLLVIINAYSGMEGLQQAVDSAVAYLQLYAEAKEIAQYLVFPSK